MTKHYAHLRYGMKEEEANGYVPLYPDPEERMRECGRSHKENAKSDFEKEQHLKTACSLAAIFTDRKFGYGRDHSAEREAYRVGLIRIYQEEANKKKED
jgi:hypothetical protein